MKKIGTGFSLLYIGFFVLAVISIANLVAGVYTVRHNKELISQVQEACQPYLDNLHELELLVFRSKMLSTNWVYLHHNVEDKKALKKLVASEYPLIKMYLQKKAKEAEGQVITDSLDLVLEEFEALLAKEKEIMTTLAGFDDYQSADKMFAAEEIIETEVLPHTSHVLKMLHSLIEKNRKNEAQIQETMNGALVNLGRTVPFLGAAIVLVAVFSGVYVLFVVTIPVQRVRKILGKLAEGREVSWKMKPGKSLVGEMVMALNLLIDNFAKTLAFANEIKAGNLNAHFKPLSDADKLGAALIEMQRSLKAYSLEMEHKVAVRTEELEKKSNALREAYDSIQASEEEMRQFAEELKAINENLAESRNELSKKNGKITDSIRYAKRIQDALLPQNAFLKRIIPQSSLNFIPKDIVSGDFYWLHEINENEFIVAVADCTGHGVPGALMTTIAISSLNEIAAVNDNLKPDEILSLLNEKILYTFSRQTEKGSETKDGMDLALCRVNKQTRELLFAGAKRPLLLCSPEDGYSEIKGSSLHIGGTGEANRSYELHRLALKPGTSVFMYSDGFPDQFGGPDDRKYLSRHFREFLQKISPAPISASALLIGREFEKWKGKRPQTDDVLVLGFRV